jgi:hypothetical protein
MTPEERKEYNKNYYTSNKIVILEKAYHKVDCKFCGRTVVQANLERHKMSELCKRTQAKQQRDNLRLVQIPPTV